MENNIHVVLLSGGSGTRLWPLSNGSRSKQFLKVLRDREGNHVSMVQRTFNQIGCTLPDVDVTVATCSSQERMLRLQIGSAAQVVVEPERRDTAPAIMLACEHLLDIQGAEAEDIVVVMPIDSFVDDGYFSKVIDLAAAVSKGCGEIALLGVEPTYPSEKYGYIVPVSPDGSPRRVESFTEKPARNKAEELISQGALWNCGVFAFKLSHVLGILNGYGDFASFEDLRLRYDELPKNSFDYEVVEKAESVAVVPYSGEWKDLGTWNTLTEEMEEKVSGFAVCDEEVCSNTHVINELDIPLIVSGVEDAVIIATVDGILVCSKKQSAGLKNLVARIDDAR